MTIYDSNDTNICDGEVYGMSVQGLEKEREARKIPAEEGKECSSEEKRA